MKTVKYRYLACKTEANRIRILEQKPYPQWNYSDVLFYFWDTEHNDKKQDFIANCKQDTDTLKYWGLLPQ